MLFRSVCFVGLFALAPVGALKADVSKPLIVRHDRGGFIGQRSKQVAKLAASGQRVELRGHCISACTLYLRLPNVCISSGAWFGFHGPSWYGKPLHPREFERWSEVLANAYNPPLRRWFMEVARYELGEPLLLRGSELIRLGYPEC